MIFIIYYSSDSLSSLVTESLNILGTLPVYGYTENKVNSNE